MLQLSILGGLSGQDVDFTTSQHTALLMLAQSHGRAVTAADATEMVNRMSSLPPHPEVAGDLARLRDTPLTVVALTNSIASVAEKQLANGGIRDSFDAVMSADAVRAARADLGR